MPTVMNPKESAEFIARVATHVKVNQTGVQRVAAEMTSAIEAGEFVPSQMMLHSYPLPVAADESSIDWLFVADTLNFSFWELEENAHYTIELKGTRYTGYMALCAAITKALENGIPITSAEYYAKISEEDTKKIFNPRDGRPIPMLEDRVKNLHQSGQILLEKFGGSFANCVKQCNQSASELLNLIVSNFPSFRDEAVIDGTSVSFYKRAQILVADIWGLFKGQGLGQFQDINCLSMFADYRVPQSLVHFGALEYSEELNEKLRNNHMWTNGGREEVEIRGCSIHAVELIRQELQQLNKSKLEDSTQLEVNSAMIDYFLWEYRRRHAKELAAIPYHKVRCIYY